jgi:lysophospholipase
MHMKKWEAENAKAVMVIVHGAAEHHGRYKWLVEMWRSSGVHVIMGDLPGHGTTTRSRRGHIDQFDEYIFEVESWLKEAFKYELPVFLLGHSMGGLVVIRALQEKHIPLKGVILSSPCLGLAEYPPKVLEWLSKGLNYVFPKMRFDTNLTVEKATRNKDVREQDENDSLYITKVSVRWYQELLKAMKLAFQNIDKLPDIPILLMQAGEDKIVNKVLVKEWFDKLHAAEKTYKEWKDLYHEIFNEPEREEVFKYAKHFVELHTEGWSS